MSNDPLADLFDKPTPRRRGSARRYDEDAALDLIAHHESGGRNIKQQVVPPGGGYNPSVGRVTGPSTASGPWQITNSTWRKRAPREIAEKYPTAMSAPVEVQRAVAGKIFRETGFQDWAPYNAALRKAIARGEQPQQRRQQDADPLSDLFDAPEQPTAPPVQLTRTSGRSATPRRRQVPTTAPAIDPMDIISQIGGAVTGQVLDRKRPKITSRADVMRAEEQPQPSTGTYRVDPRLAKGEQPLDRAAYAKAQELVGRVEPIREVGGIRAGATAMGPRQQGVGERIYDVLSRAPGIRSLDTPAGVKTDPIRGALSLGMADLRRTITPEEKIIDPDAEAKAETAYQVGAFAPAVVPYAAAGKAVSKIPSLNAATREAHIARSALTFGGVELGRELARSTQTGEPLNPKEVAISTAIGGGIGGIAGVNPGLKKQLVAFITPGVVADVARGTDPETATFNALTNLAFGLHSYKGAPREVQNAAKLAAEPLQRRLQRGELQRENDATNPYPARTKAASEIIQEVPPPRGTIDPQNAKPDDLGRRLPSDTGDIASSANEPFQPRMQRPTSELRSSSKIASPERLAARGTVAQESSADLVAPAPSVKAEFQHKDFGRVVEAESQTGVSRGQIRVTDAQGTEHVILKPKGTGAGNIRAIPVKPEPPSVAGEWPVRERRALTERRAKERRVSGRQAGQSDILDSVGAVDTSVMGVRKPARVLLGNIPRQTLQSIAANDLAEWGHLSSREVKIERAINKAVAGQSKGLTEFGVLYAKFGSWEKTLSAVREYLSGNRPEQRTGERRRGERRVATSDLRQPAPQPPEAAAPKVLVQSVKHETPPAEVSTRPSSETSAQTTPAVPLLKREVKPVEAPAVLTRKPSVSSARQEMTARDRAELDLPDRPLAERKSWQRTLEEAKAKGSHNASVLADEVLAKPRALNDVETAQLVLRASELKTIHAERMKEIGSATDPDVIQAKRNEVEAVEREFDKLTTATKASGTEKGRALASQKLTINQDFDLVSVLQRAKAARGRELRPEERQKIETQTKRIEELEGQLAEAQKAAEARAIQRDIERVRRQIKRGETKQVLDDEFALLKTEFAQIRMEIKESPIEYRQGGIGLASLDPSGKLTPIILKMARNRVKAGVVEAEKVISEVYGVVKEHVEGITQDDIRNLLAGHNLEHDPLPAIKTRLRGQEKELTRRLEEKDYAPPPKRKPVVYDREASNLKARVEQLKRQIDADIQGNDSRVETALNMWKAGLLTGPRTHLRNIGGTGGFQVFEEVARVPGAITDLIVSGVRKATTGEGRRALSGPSPVAVARSSYEAATKGVREAAQIIRYGATAEELKIIDRPREANSGSKIIDAYINTVFRTLGAEDKIFRTYAYKRSIIEQAKLRAKSEGKTAKELEENPTAEMVSQGLLDAEVATFNNENIAAKGVTWAREHSGPVGKIAIDLTVPFKRTPANIMTRLLESTPLGLLKGGGQLIRAGVNKKFTFEDQRKFSQTIGRSVTGSALIILGWKLAEAGLATGLYEEDRGDREAQKAAGRSPMAVRIGNTWHQIGSFSPIGNLIAIGAALHREKTRPPKEGEEPRNIPAAMLPIAAKTMMEQPMLKGVAGVADAIQEPGSRGATFVGRTLGSAIPTIVSDVGALTDNRRREARSIADRVKVRVPILRRTLPEDIDVFARPLEARRAAVVDPTLSTTAKDEPFIRELIRLDVGIVKSNKKQGESDQQHRERVVAQGKEMAKELAKVTDSPAYKTASDDGKREMIKDKVEQVRKAVNEYIKTGGKRSPREPRGLRPTRYIYRPNQ